jgi:hypothetical protein
LPCDDEALLPAEWVFEVDSPLSLEPLESSAPVSLPRVVVLVGNR